MEMKPINVTRSSMPPFEEYCREIRDLWESRWLTNSGAKYQALEREMKAYLGVPYLEFYSNGHLALEAILAAMDLTGEVITTPFTYASTTQAIVRSGLTPVFCDVEPEWYTMDPDRIEALITERTSAILPVHVYGHVCRYKEIEAIAEKHHLKVIYDAAHAFGETVDGVGIGSIGDAAMFSFHATKVFHTIEGGGAAYRDEGLTEALQAWKMFGMVGKEDAEYVGTNAKMTEFQAAMGLCNLRHVNEEIAKRKRAADMYRSRLGNVPGLRIPAPQPHVQANYAYFPVYVDEAKFGRTRDEVADLLGARQIYARKYFYPITSAFSAYQGRFAIQDTPQALDASLHILTLPLYADLDEETVSYICDVLLEE